MKALLLIACILVAINASAADSPTYVKSLLELKHGNTASGFADMKAAAEQGEPQAQFDLAGLYIAGIGVAKDEAQAAPWIQKSADGGYPPAQINIAQKYEKGLGVPVDMAQAIVWYRKAADEGFALAQVKLGFVYQQGLGAPKDYAQAIAWYRKAIAQGEKNAVVLLGTMYAEGLGGKPDYVTGYAMLGVAASTPGPNQANAITMRDAVAKAMSPGQLDAAKALMGQMQRDGVGATLDKLR